MQRDAARLLHHDRARDRVAAPRGSEHGARVVRRRERRPRAGREPLRDSGECCGTRIEVLLEPDANVVELARRAVVPALQLAPQDESRSETGADREEDEVVDAVRDAEAALAERGEVDVVRDRHRHSEPLLQLRPERTAVQPRDVEREPDRAAVLLDDAGDADDYLLDELRLEACRIGEALAQLHDRVECAVGVAAELDVLSRAHPAGEIAEHTAEEARTEVDRQHERRLVHRLEVDGAVARPAGAVRGFAHEAGVEQRLEGERDGRLRDPRTARDLRTRDGRTGADRPQHRFLVQPLE